MAWRPMLILLLLSLAASFGKGIGGNENQKFLDQVREDVRLWGCENRTMGYDQRRILMAFPGDPAWDDPGHCNRLINTPPPCSDPYPELEGSSPVKTYSLYMFKYAVYSECKDGKRLLSGHPGYLTQCGAGTWAQIYDVCDEGCELPRDCCSIASLKYTGTDESNYMVVPSGDPDANVTEVWCPPAAEDNVAEKGWTLVLQHDKDSDYLSMTNWSYVQGTIYSSSYFIGIQHLADLCWNGTNERPLIMQITMEEDDEVEEGDRFLHATYDHVIISRDTYVLKSLGLYSGNAGDHLVGRVGHSFCPDRSEDNKEPCWWGGLSPDRDSFLTSAAPFWGDIFLTTVKIVVRPKACDEVRSCPLLTSFLNIEDETTVPLSRAPGTTFDHKCAELMMGVREDGTTSEKGSFICQSPAVKGGQPKWREVIPCTLVCPDGYVKSQDGQACLTFSSRKAQQGHTEAVAKCAKLNASLAFIHDPEDLKTAKSDRFYLTAYTIRRDGEVFPEIPGTFQDNGFTCATEHDSCYEKRRDRCVLMQQGGQYTPQGCHRSMYYACMRPARCPTSYTLYEGRCYKILNVNSSTHLEALDRCNYDGSGLAYPEDLQTLDFLAQLAKSEVEWAGEATTAALALGFTTRWENLTLSGLYSPDVDVAAALNTSDNSLSYTLLTINQSSDDWFVEHVPPNSAINHAICQFRGPIGCWQAKPWAKNTNNDWDNLRHVLGMNLTYWCKDGYFVDGVVGDKTPQYRQCLGQLGGWWPRHPPLKPCIPVEVCLETFPPAPADMILQWTSSSRYETYTIRYNCQYYGMSNREGLWQQTLTCTHQVNTTYRYEGNVTQCDRCFTPPTVTNADTDWQSGIWLIGDSVNATCHPGYLVTYNVDHQLINCTNMGWVSLPCLKVCHGEPQVANASTSWVEGMWIEGSSVHVTCHDDLYFPSLKANESDVQCTAEGWASHPPCQQVCLEELKVENATVDDEDRMWAVGDNASVTCLPHHFFLTNASLQHYVSLINAILQYHVSLTSTTLQHHFNLTNATLHHDINPSRTILQQYPNLTSAASLQPHANLTNDTTVAILQQSVVECRLGGWEQITGCTRVCEDEPRVENAFTSWEVGMWVEGDKVNATCHEDHYLLPEGSQHYTVECTDSGWQANSSCDKVCLGEPQMINATTDWVERLWPVGQSVNATCKDDLYFLTLYSQTRSVLCSPEGWETQPSCQEVPPNPACSMEPEVGNATTDWHNGSWSVGEVVTATCHDLHYFINDSSQQQQQLVLCLEDGWQNITGCQRICSPVCEVEPLVANAKTTWVEGTWRVGDQVTVNCEEDHMFVSEESQQLQMMCTEYGREDSPGVACEGEPHIGGATTDWQAGLWTEGEAVNATCLPNHYLMPSGGRILTVSCTDAGWENATECEAGCVRDTENGNFTFEWENRAWTVGETVTFTCPEEHLTRDGDNITIFNCTLSGWHNPSPCIKLCVDEPLVENAEIDWLNRSWWVGDNLNATCHEQYHVPHLDPQNRVFTLNVTCTMDGWGNKTGCVNYH